MNIWNEIEDVLEAYDGHLELKVAAGSCWNGEIGIRLSNPCKAPARYMVFFSAGGSNPTDVARRLLNDYDAWRISAEELLNANA